MSATSNTIADAHCHPQLDVAHLRDVAQLKAQYVAAMGVSSQDWAAIDELARLVPDKVIPCFGVHPWKAHLHASRSFTGDVASVADISTGAAESADQDSAFLTTSLISGWEEELMQRLQSDPRAIVGECGVDRAARIPGLNAHTNYDHQRELMMMHFEMAARLQRPISVHCVKAYGHLQDILRGLDESACPPRIMLHSYGGSPDMVASLVKIGHRSPTGVGTRLYFSFSAAVSSKASKFLARLQAVPDDRILLESDETVVGDIDAGLETIVRLVAEAKGWTEEETVTKCWANFNRFYHGFLPAA